MGHQPHILFVLADDYGFHDIGYHMAEILTPNMDKLAKEGVILENYYVQQVCTPTRAQLMTGRYQIRYGMQHGVVRPPQPDGIPLDEKLIPDALKQCGYNTEMIGKWHLGFFQKEYCPQYRGYDHFLGFLTGSEDFYTHEKCFFGMCGYDFREAYAQQPEVIRYDLNDTYSTGIFTTGLHKRLSVLDPKVPLFTFLSFQSGNGFSRFSRSQIFGQSIYSVNRTFRTIKVFRVIIIFEKSEFSFCSNLNFSETPKKSTRHFKRQRVSLIFIVI